MSTKRKAKDLETHVMEYGTTGKRRKRYRVGKSKGRLPVELPVEILYLVFDQLDRPDDALRLMAASKTFWNAGRSHQGFWKRFWPHVKLDRVISPEALHRQSCLLTCKEFYTLYKNHKDARPRDIRTRHYEWTWGNSVTYGEMHCVNEAHYSLREEVPTRRPVPDDACNAVLKALSKRHLKEKKRMITHRTRNLDMYRRELKEANEKLSFWRERVDANVKGLQETKEMLDHVVNGHYIVKVDIPVVPHT